MHDDPGAHGNEQLSKNGANATRAAGMGPRQNKAVVAKRPVVKLTGTGLAVKQPADNPTSSGLAAKTAGR